MRSTDHIVTFGEAMLRLTPPVGVALEAAVALDVEIGGAEANVAAALAALGTHAKWVSSLPEDARGRAVLGRMRARGVDTTHVSLVPGGRMGIYFYERGVAPRLGRVVYDRAGSTFALSSGDDFPVAALAEARLLHLSGITPALGAGPDRACRRAVDAARGRGVTVSFDLNYRAALSSPAQAADAFWSFAADADIVFVNGRDGAAVLGVIGDAAQQAAALRHRLPRTACVVTAGASGASAADADGVHTVAAVDADVVDRLGRGDAFCAGFLWGWLHRGTEYGLRCGVALAALQQTYVGDVAWSTEDDLLRCLDGVRDVHR